MFKGFTKNRNLLSIVISIVVFILVYIISISNWLHYFDKKIWDIYFDFNKSNILINRDLIVVQIDDTTLSWRKDSKWNITKQWLWRFPFDRKYYAKVIDNLKDAWVAVIAIDVIFWEKSNEKSDSLLAESIKKSWNVVLWLWRDTAWFITEPYNKFWENIISMWYYSPNVDELTQKVYSIYPFYSEFRWTNETFEHFSIATLRAYYSYMYNDKSILDTEVLSTENNFILGDKIELLKSRPNDDELLINYADSNRFTKYSFLDIYNWDFDKSLLKDKIVVIWATAKWIKDIFDTPIWPAEYWVYTHVNILNTILTKNYIRYFDKSLEWLLIFLMIIVSAYFNITRSSKVLIFSNIALVSAFIILVIYVTIATNLLFNYPAELALSLLLSLTVSNVVKYVIENKHKKKLNKALSEYVSKDVAEEVLSWEWKVNLNWEIKNTAIFFSDIEWFTTISEKFSPEELVWFLREYLKEMSDIIMDKKWFINKYEWDAIMALWWVFWINKQKESDICVSALEQQKRLKELNKVWKTRWFSTIKARIWIHMWPAIIWNIWSKWRKMEFTALWDNVNLASRLEWVNKYYNTYICVSEDVYKVEKNNFEFRFLDKIRVKWKQNAISIYELISYKWEITKTKKDILTKFKKALDLYKKMKFEEALVIFSELSRRRDWPSKAYKSRCEAYIKNPPWSKWDWIWTMQSK